MDTTATTRTNAALAAHAASRTLQPERFDYDEADRLSRLAGEAHAAWLAAAALWRKLPALVQHQQAVAGAYVQQLQDASMAATAAVNSYHARTARPYAVTAEVFFVQPIAA